MPERTTEDRLREEYFDLLPQIRNISLHLETEIKYLTLPLQKSLARYEQLVVRSRIKDCESAINTLRLRQEGNVFDPESSYSITDLNDMAGARVLVFPSKRLGEADNVLRRSEIFAHWTSKPLSYAGGSTIPKYFGSFEGVNSRILAEYQIVPMLMGLFWEVEHSAMYKPVGWAKGIDSDAGMKARRVEVESALFHFDRDFEEFLSKNAQSPSSEQS